MLRSKPNPHRAKIDRLARICRRWGGELKFEPIPDPLNTALYALRSYERHDSRYMCGWEDHLEAIAAPYRFHSAPACSWHGFVFETKTIYCVEEYACPGAIIHEMGHVFVDNYLDLSDEWAWLGWEVQLARQIGCFKIWSEQNDHYGLGDSPAGLDGNFEWGDLKGGDLYAVINDRVEFAMDAGLLDKRGRPLPIRMTPDRYARASYDVPTRRPFQHL